MPRLPSDVWQHFTQVDVNGKPLWTCKYCGKAYVKNATKLQLHIVKCQQFLQASVRIAKSSISVETQPVSFDTGTLPSVAGTSGTLLDYIDSMDGHSRRTADECFARAVYATNSPLTLTSNMYWQRFYNVLHPAYNPPTVHALSTYLLDDEFERMQAAVKQTINKTECISVISEGWSNGRGVINYAVTASHPLFYKSTDTTEHTHTAAYIAEELKNVIEEVGPGKVFALITDSTADMEEAWAHVEQTYPHISTIGCAAQSFNLLLKDIMMLKSMDTLNQIATQVEKFVKGNREAFTRIYVSKQKQKMKSTQSKASCGVVSLYERLLDGQESLKEMASSQPAEIEREMQRILLDNMFWERLSSALIILKPIANAIVRIESVEALLSDVVGLFAELKEEMQTVLPFSLLLQAEEAAVLELVEKHRKLCQKPVHAAAFMLDPKYDRGVMSGEEVSRAYTAITTLSDHLGLDSGLVLGSLAKYRTKQGLWKGNGIWQARKHISACTWWNGLCTSEAIAPVAVNILQVPPSAASVCRTTKEKVHLTLTDERQKKLVAVRANLRLFEADTETSPTRLDSDSEEEGGVMDNGDWPRA